MRIIDVEGIGMPMVITKATRCQGCPATIYFSKFPNGNSIPLHETDDGIWVNHFTDCPQAIMFRKQKELTTNKDMV